MVDDKALEKAKLDPTSVFYLGSNDNPENIITQIVLHGENYNDWARSIRLSLKARRKFGFVDGKIAKPMTEPTLEFWFTNYSMLSSWILNTVDPTLRSTLSYYENATLLWTDLQERFCIVNRPHIQQLKSSIGDCKQLKNETVVTYFGRLKQLWDELSQYEPIPGCECGACKCDLGAKFAKIQEVDRLHRFLIDTKISLQLLLQETSLEVLKKQ